MAPQSSKFLLIGSTEACSGKSGTIIGITNQLQNQGLKIGYGKPLGTYLSPDNSEAVEEDVSFIPQALNLPTSQVKAPLLYLDQKTLNQRLQGKIESNYADALKQYVRDVEADLMLLEGASTLWEGSLFELSVRQIAQGIDAKVLLVSRFHSLISVDVFLAAQKYLGEHLLGIVINDIPLDQLDAATTHMKPFLEEQGIPVLGLLPRNNLLRSVSVRELYQRLGAKILCRQDRLDLMVEKLTIGAMNVNAALGYFRQGRNMAVITGGDRTELQLAALETSTNCLILTGHNPPKDFVLTRAEDLEIPILSVDLDTLSTVEIVDNAFGQARLQEPIKVSCIQQLMEQHFDLDRLVEALGLEVPVPTS